MSERAMSKPDDKPVSSPASTGGAGTHFEQHVDATFLAFLLVCGIPPVLKDCQVTEVHFQTERKGWHTDDVLVVGTTGSGGARKLACQVKRTFNITKSNEDCEKAFLDFWHDFTLNTEFRRDKDAFGLITLRGTNTLLRDFTLLLDTARSANSCEDFAQRLSTKGLVSQKAQNQAAVIRGIIDEDGTPVEDDEFWQFLRTLHVVSYDLTTTSAQTEGLVKTLLRQSTSEPDAGEAANVAWLKLVELASAGMSSACSFVRDDLPKELRSKHSEHGAAEFTSLRVLGEHSATVLGGIVGTIGEDVTLPRREIVDELLFQLERDRVVVVTGPAGSGKSVIAKTALESLSKDHLCFAFRAEEFDAPHLDATLHRAQVDVTADRLAGMLAAQGRKVLLVESVERLLEATTRESFADLLQRVRADGSWRVLLTCRDYSVEIVRSSLLAHACLSNALLAVPDLTDDELQQVVAQLPVLARPAGNTRLKELLRRPYVLNMAYRMEWGSEATMPEDERSFRRKFWSDIVREDVHGADGLPQRRSATFVEIAVRRAKALSALAPCGDLDQRAVAKLRTSNLLRGQSGYDSAAAPAHDVLEDWAVLHWLDERFQLHERSASKLSDDVGGLPALRRGYRKWMSEMLECEADEADKLILASLTDAKLPAHFKDDTTVAMLLSSQATGFLERHKDLLLQEECALLRRVIHLLRVACRTSPIWIKGDPGLPSEMLVPDGAAWAPVLRLAVSAFDSLLPKEAPLLAGLIDDWSKSVAWWNPHPEGAKEAATIAFALVPSADSYRAEALRKRVFGVIAKVPKAKPEAFVDLLERAGDIEGRDSIARKFAEFVLGETNAWFACRCFPDEVIALAERQFCMTEDDLRGAIRHSSSGMVEFFGLRTPLEHDFFPPSSLRGPFLGLLEAHPRKGCDFIVRLLNHAATWYSEKRWPGFRLEELFEVSIEIPGHGKIKQLANGSFWGAYRGMAGVPRVLECALMALESWLLGLAAKESPHTEAWLLKCLTQSNNAAVTAVVASVCVAYPKMSGAAGLAVLSCKDFFELDLSRQLNESRPRMFSHMSLPEWHLYDNERKQSGELPHRTEHLERLAVRLQLTEKRDSVFHLLDEFHRALPEPENQTSEHKLWRLALHRMDVRTFEPTEPPEGHESEDDTEIGDRTYFAPRPPDADIEESLSAAREARERMNADLALMNWAHATWDRSGKAEPALWRDKLAVAKQRIANGTPLEELAQGGPSYVACVCLRDNWDDLDEEDREWCIERAVGEITATSGDYELSNRVSNLSTDPTRPAAHVLPKVYSKLAVGSLSSRVGLAIAHALTHPAKEVVEYAAHAVGHYLACTRADFTLNAVGALAMKARLLANLAKQEGRRDYRHRRHPSVLDADIDPRVRSAIVAGGIDTEKEVSTLNLETWSGRVLTTAILSILGSCPEHRIAQDAHLTVARTLASYWEHARSEGGHRLDRDLGFEHDSLRRLAAFVLRLPTDQALVVCEPLFAAVEHDRDLEPFASALIYAEDTQRGVSPFWDVWQELANRVRCSRWAGRLNSLDTEHSVPGLLRSVFLLAEWNEGVDHWRRLEGEAHRIDEFFLLLPPSGAAIEGYVRFLLAIGSRSLPAAFLHIARKLQASDANELLARRNSTFVLESLLRRYVYNEPVRLKSTPQLRAAVVACLDCLVESGSSGAYRMRDDFVTPLPPVQNASDA